MKSRYRKIRIGNKTFDEHRLVMEQILGRPLTGNETVHHLNGDGLDNSPENLCVMPQWTHAKLHSAGRVPLPPAALYGVKNPAHKLTEKDIGLIDTYLKLGYSTKRIGGKFGVSDWVIRKIRDGINWSHVTKRPLAKKSNGQKLEFAES
jgi:hypothetical protein